MKALDSTWRRRREEGRNEEFKMSSEEAQGKEQDKRRAGLA